DVCSSDLARLVKGQRDLALEAVELRIGLRIPEHRQRCDLFARVQRVDEIREVVVVGAQRPMDTVLGMAMQSDVERMCGFLLQVRSADFETGDRKVRSVRIELDALWMALRSREIR